MNLDPDAVLRDESYPQEQLAMAILNRHYASLHFLAYSLLGDSDEADDAVQDVIIRALKKIDSYRPGSNMQAWLSRITVNQCRDMLRQRGARRRLEDRFGNLWRRSPSPPSPEKMTEISETKTALWSLVNQLGDKHRLPIILRFIHNLTVPEIAEILDIREGTAHSRLHYACTQLGRQLTLTDREQFIKELRNE